MGKGLGQRCSSFGKVLASLHEVLYSIPTLLSLALWHIPLNPALKGGVRRNRHLKSASATHKVQGQPGILHETLPRPPKKGKVF